MPSTRRASGWAGFAQRTLDGFSLNMRALGPSGRFVPGELCRREVADPDGSVRWKLYLVVGRVDDEVYCWLGPEGRDPPGATAAGTEVG